MSNTSSSNYGNMSTTGSYDSGSSQSWGGIPDNMGQALQRSFGKTASGLGHEVQDNGFILAK